MTEYWLTPPELEPLRDGHWDPCPYPRPVDWDCLTVPWKKPWYCNPPFHQAARFTRKAIQEGGPGILIVPVTHPTHILLEAGAELHPLGRVRWLDTRTGRPAPAHEVPVCMKAIL